MTLERKLAYQLIAQGKTLSIAESCTGGLISHRLTNIPGSSQFLKVGLITYSNEAKITLLQVPLNIIKRYGAVSSETVKIMAKNVRKIFKTHLGLSITGIAGPTGDSKQKPIGLTYIAVSTSKKLYYKKFNFTGSRLEIKNLAATSALELLLKFSK